MSPKNGKLYGMNWSCDGAKHTLHWGNFCKLFDSYNEMEDFVLTCNCRRFQMNIMASYLEEGDIIEVEATGIKNTEAEVVSNNPKRGCLVLDINGNGYGLAYNDIDEIKIIKKKREVVVVC